MNEVDEIRLFIYKRHQNIVLEQSVNCLVSDSLIRCMNLVEPKSLTSMTLLLEQDLSNSRAVAWLLLLS